MATDSREQFLIICESFYNIQGEGATAGKPAVFLRLAGCNLRCNGFSYKDPATGQHLGCDSKLLWLQGTKRRFCEILTYWAQQGWLDYLNQGAHLIITGGEPLIQQASLVEFINQLNSRIFIEVETNGTIAACETLKNRVNQFNVSPKLIHSGEAREKAFKREIIAEFAALQNSVFKFVIAQSTDVDEVIENYVNPFRIQSNRVWLMPEGGTQAKINAIKPWLVESCKKHLFNFTTRLQIDIWQEVTGV